MKLRRSLEAQLQMQVINFLRLNHIFCFSVPNGGSRHNILEAKKLKKTGVWAGVADIIVLLQNRIIFLELKAGKNKQAPKQKEFQIIANSLGHEYYIIYDLEGLNKIDGLLTHNIKSRL